MFKFLEKLKDSKRKKDQEARVSFHVDTICSKTNIMINHQTFKIKEEQFFSYLKDGIEAELVDDVVQAVKNRLIDMQMQEEINLQRRQDIKKSLESYLE